MCKCHIPQNAVYILFFLRKNAVNVPVFLRKDIIIIWCFSSFFVILWAKTNPDDGRAKGYSHSGLGTSASDRFERRVCGAHVL